jgi:hypothetical protein
MKFAMAQIVGDYLEDLFSKDLATKSSNSFGKVFARSQTMERTWTNSLGPSLPPSTEGFSLVLSLMFKRYRIGNWRCRLPWNVRSSRLRECFLRIRGASPLPRRPSSLRHRSRTKRVFHRKRKVILHRAIPGIRDKGTAGSHRSSITR